MVQLSLVNDSISIQLEVISVTRTTLMHCILTTLPLHLEGHKYFMPKCEIRYSNNLQAQQFIILL